MVAIYCAESKTMIFISFMMRTIKDRTISLGYKKIDGSCKSRRLVYSLKLNAHIDAPFFFLSINMATLRLHYVR